MGDSFGQLATVTAFLGGFVVTFLGALCTLRDDRRRVGFAIGVATSAAACLLLSALGWALLATHASNLTGVDAAGRIAALQRLKAGMAHMTLLSELFFFGIILIVILLGTVGWLRSRRLGIFTTVLAVLMALGALTIVRPFVWRASETPPTASPGAASVQDVD